eukprot:Clim_evm7s244 gene=Clim_evmTU7s244
MVQQSLKAAKPAREVLAVENLNKRLLEMEYAVRGEIAITAEDLAERVEKGEQLPFKQVVRCNIGNPQQVGQKPITFFREVMSLCQFPDLFQDPDRLETTKKLFAPDAIERARTLINSIGSAGAYSNSKGHAIIRKSVAKYIEERDGYPSDQEHIYLTNGASSGVNTVCQAVIQNAQVGVMIPIPQYPLYSATLTLLGGTAVPYYLDEENGWATNLESIKNAHDEAKANGVDVRALAIINPGNPTGGCLKRSQMEEIVNLCAERGILIMADEVYQDNIYYPEEFPFVSFKKVIRDMDSEVECVSFHSTSKGFIGECGARGGYMEFCNVSEETMGVFYKAASVALCSNIPGQIMTEVLVNPPKAGDASFELYSQERDAILTSLKRRAELLVETFNSLEGMSCQRSAGAMYTFPKIKLPQKAIEEADRQGKAPDTLYCLELLKNTGVCTVSGTGFKQEEGTYHLRCTFLPPEETFKDFIGNIKQFHEEFMDKYRD